MRDVRGGDDYVGDSERKGLGGEDDVGIDGRITRSGLAGLAGLRPKLGSSTHGRCREG